MDRFGDKVCCNPTVKLKKQESYPVIDIDKITPGYKAVRSVASIEYTGQGGAKFQDHDVLFVTATCFDGVHRAPVGFVEGYRHKIAHSSGARCGIGRERDVMVNNAA